MTDDVQSKRPERRNQLARLEVEEEARLSPGLYLVSTPIGNAADISLRALDILARADVVACEDTRRARMLLDIHGVALAGRPLIAYHDHNGAGRRPGLIARMNEGASLAYVSDAGAPLVADPGYRLVEAALEAELAVIPVPGPSAVLAALSVAGLPTDRFLFNGFLPVKAGPRRRALAELAGVPATLVFFEAPHRLTDALSAMGEVLGPDRRAAVARELTKKFEETVRGSLGELTERYTASGPPKGEIVIVVGPPGVVEAEEADIDAALRRALAGASVRDAARQVAEAMGIAKKQVYARALALSKEAK